MQALYWATMWLFKFRTTKSLLSTMEDHHISLSAAIYL